MRRGRWNWRAIPASLPPSQKLRRNRDTTALFDMPDSRAT